MRCALRPSLLIAEALVGFRFILYIFIPFFVISDERLGRLDLGLAWGILYSSKMSIDTLLKLQ